MLAPTRSRSRSGFTLVELVVAMALLIGILMASGVAIAAATRGMVDGRARDAANTLAFSTLERTRTYGCGTLTGSVPNHSLSDADKGTWRQEQVDLAERCEAALFVTPGADVSAPAIVPNDDLPASSAASSTSFDAVRSGASCASDPSERCYRVTIATTWRTVGSASNPCAPGVSTTPPRLLARKVTVDHFRLQAPVVVESLESVDAEAPTTPERGTGSLAVRAPAGTLVTLRSVEGGHAPVPVHRTASSAGCAWFPHLFPGSYSYAVGTNAPALVSSVPEGQVTVK